MAMTETARNLDRLAREFFSLAAVDPALALERAERVQADARRQKAWSAMSIAARAAGISANSSMIWLDLRHFYALLLRQGNGVVLGD